MNWARGLKFAGIHLAIAIPLIASEEIPRWQTEKIHSEVHKNSVVLAAFQEEPSTVEFTPICNEWRSISSAEKLLSVAETPALILSGWNSDCPARWTSAGILGIDIRHHSLMQRLESDFSFCCLIAIQWILLGGLPLVRPRRWWREPGAANTALACAAAVLCLAITGLEMAHLHPAESITAVFGLIAALAFLLILSTWLAWICLMLERLCRFGWQAASASLRWARSR
jgi:hypothetical protein